MPVVHDVAEHLDGPIEHSRQELGTDLGSMALALDARYQDFMVQRIDPLYGRARNAQLAELGGLDISPQERILNRRGGALWPASLALTMPASFLLALPVYEMARRSVQQQRRVTYHVVSAISVTAVWLTGQFVPGLAALVFFYMGEKLLLIVEDRSRKGLITVFSKQPRTVWRLRDGREFTPFVTSSPTSWPSRSDSVARCAPTTAVSPYSRATTARAEPEPLTRS